MGSYVVLAQVNVKNILDASCEVSFFRKKRLLQIRWMLRCLRIKRDIKGSIIKEGRNLKGYTVRGVFQK